MGKIREKLLDFKQRLSDRKMYSIVLTVIAIISTLAIYQYKAKLNYKNFLQNSYDRTFFDLVGYVQNVEVSLSKTMVSSTPNQTTKLLSDVWRESNFAQSSLGQLPISNNELQKTSRFLSQVGDFSYSLSNQLSENKDISEEQWKSIKSLHNLSLSLEKSLITLENEIQGGRSMWGELQSEGPKIFKSASKNLASETAGEIEKQFQDYPSLIYDGPFSEHIEKIVPALLEDKKDVTLEEAYKIAKKFVGENKVKEISNPTNGNGTIKTYSTRITGSTTPKESEIIVDITQKGGYVLYMLNSRPLGEGKINVEKAIGIASKFLDSKGYKNMQDTYYMSDSTTVTINFAYVQNKITMYSDLIKVKVALDNGEIVGFESKGYIMSHKERKLPPPVITENEVRKMLNSNLEAKNIGLAVIPLESKQEVFVYEVKGNVGDRNFLTYINALNGKEEKILVIIHAPNGVLTM